MTGEGGAAPGAGRGQKLLHVVVEGAASEIKLPATLDWYRQGANWLVGLSTGAAAVGLTYLDKIGSLDSPSRVLCGLAGIFFLLAILSGILFYFWITALANGLEAREQATQDKAKPENASKGVELDKKIEKAEVKITRAKKWFPRFYRLLLLAFPLGVIIIAAIILMSVVKGKDVDKHYSLFLVPTPSSNSAVNPGGPVLVERDDVLRLEDHSGKTWILAREPGGAYKWREVHSDNGATANSQTPRPTPTPAQKKGA